VDRDGFVALAYFLGSDYTAGVSGIGVVNAMEILQTFPMTKAAGGALNGLKLFRDWLRGYDIKEELREAFEYKRNKTSSKKAVSASSAPESAKSVVEETGATAGNHSDNQSLKRRRKTLAQAKSISRSKRNSDSGSSDEDFVVGDSGVTKQKKQCAAENGEVSTCSHVEPDCGGGSEIFGAEQSPKTPNSPGSCNSLADGETSLVCLTFFLCNWLGNSFLFIS
jgi:hypothetical protein